MLDINVFSLFFVTEIMSLIISYQPIAVLSQAQWWQKLVCVRSPVSYFQRRYVSCWNSCGMNTSCLFHLACLCLGDILGAVLLFQMSSSCRTCFPLFPCLGSQCSNVIMFNDVIILGDGKSYCHILVRMERQITEGDTSWRQTAHFFWFCCPGSLWCGWSFNVIKKIPILSERHNLL